MRPITLLLFALALLSVLPLGVPRGTLAAASPAVQPLQKSTLPYTWTVSRGTGGSYTIPLAQQFLSYSFYPNGTLTYNGFKVRSFQAKWGSLAANMPLPFTSLQYNSTFVEYVLNMTVLGNSMSLVTSYRQISGTDNLLVTLSGTLSAAGFVSESFTGSGRKIWQNQTLTWGAAGYDWSDSKAQSPVFDNATNTVTWATPGNFKVDPVTLGTSGLGVDLVNDPTRGVFTTSTGIIFVFWCNSASQKWLYYSSSPDGGTTWTALNTTYTLGSCQNYSTWYDGTYLYLVDPASQTGCINSTSQVCLITGTVSGGTISFGSWQLVGIGAALGSGPTSVTTDSNGNIWIAIAACCNTMSVAKCTCTGQAAWVAASGFPATFGVQTPHSLAVTLDPLTGGKMALLYGTASTGLNMSASSGGASFNSFVVSADSLTSAATLGDGFSSVAVQDDVYVVEQVDNPTRSIRADVYRYQSNSWDQSVLLDDRSGISTGRLDPVISYDQTSKTFYAFWSHGQGVLWYATLPLTGQWASPQQFISGENNFVQLNANLATSYYAASTAPFLVGRDTVPVVWEVFGSGSSCTCNIRYQGLYVNVVPQTPLQQQSTSPFPPFQFNTTTFTIPVIGLNVTLPVQLANQNSLLLLLAVPGVVLVSANWRELRDFKNTSLIRTMPLAKRRTRSEDDERQSLI